MKYAVFDELPVDFQPTVEVASCYCEHREKILLLKRHLSRPQGGTWGVPAGKLENGENPRAAVVREVCEEVGLQIGDKDLHEMGKLYIKLPHFDYIYHMFYKHFLTQPQIDLGLEEHEEAVWVTLEDARKLPLIAGAWEALEFYKKFRKELANGCA